MPEEPFFLLRRSVCPSFHCHSVESHRFLSRSIDKVHVRIALTRIKRYLIQEMKRSPHYLLMPLTLLLLFMAANLTIGPVAAQVTDATTDQSALLALKSQVTNDPKKILTNNWSATTSVCNWVGVTCGLRHLRVMALNLSYMGLTGTIPPRLGNLSFLVSLNLRNNSFHGNLPHDLAHLHRLRYIGLGFNNFMGTIPAWFGFLSKLETLLLFSNQFSGQLPTAIFNLSALQMIQLHNNQLTGSIPSEIGNLTMLKEMYLDSNKLTEIPDEIRTLDRLEVLMMQDNALKGPIPLAVLNMSSLTTLALTGNRLNGSIPENICQHLPSLEELYLGHNQFDGPLPSKLWQCRELRGIVLPGNEINGNISRNIGNLTQIVIISLFDNKLTGTIPNEIIDLQHLQQLALGLNNLKGSIPKNIWNMTQLGSMILNYNSLTGTIPDEIGALQHLQELVIQENNFNGSIPSTIFNMSMMRFISLNGNQFSGSLPASIGLGIPNLEWFTMGRNQLSGAIPNFISNTSKLRKLDMSMNSFTGFIPSTLCALTRLELLHLARNNLRVDTSTPEANVFSCLHNLGNLTILSFASNPLNMTLPVSIGDLSASLELLRLRSCNMRGNIPNEIGNLGSLISLELGNNQFNGSIPKTIGRLRNLQGLKLTDNRLQGHIPKELCQLNNLAELHLGNNELSGSLLSCIGHLGTLRELSLESNLLTSAIPSTLWRLKDILYLDLSSNLLNGCLSEDIGNLKVVTVLDISNNHLSGSLPASMGYLQYLVNLSLANNNLEGHIPTSFGNILSVELLDLSKNSLSGVIPMSLEALKQLKNLNLSFNRLQGEIPTGGPFQNFSAQSFVSNGPLCGAARFGVPECQNSTRKASKSKLKFIIPGIISAILLVAIAVVLIILKKGKVEVATETTLLTQLHWRRFSHLELLRATNGFDEKNLLGTGGFASVYKGTLSDGIHVAVKVFNLQLEGAFKSFDTECEVLSNIVHRNLIKVISCCSQLDFKALILQYMPNGSLENWLYSQTSPLNILQRLNILIDAALALEYLHHGSSIPVVHCDVKPSNILLDDDMVACVADFGITKLLGEGDSMVQTMTQATVGYIAPEFGTDGIVSTRGDVYSFGIVLMETFTKRKPTDEMFGGEMNLKQWIANSLTPDGAMVEVVDSDLLGTEEDRDFVSRRDCISSIMELALACSTELPEERISMKDAAATLKKIKIKFLKDCGGVKL